jgi:NAD(P)-dependent dehydrogenase (short-subunit alcohol dehydrogenase family)
MKHLDAKIVVVTGAGTGIGRAIVHRIAGEGGRVALLGRRRELLEQTVAEVGGEHLVLPTDVRDRSAIDGAFDRIREEMGAPGAVVANAGLGGPNLPGDEDRWDEVVRTNLDGTYWTLRAFERTSAGGDDLRHAVVVSSCLARFGVPGYSAYCASKAGLLGMVRALALEWAAERILVNAVCPGWVDTEMARRGMELLGEATGRPFAEAKAAALDEVPLKRMSEPDEIAGLVAFLLSPDARSFTGQSIDPNNGAWMG